jgi:hypothetical protein
MGKAPSRRLKFVGILLLAALALVLSLDNIGLVADDLDAGWPTSRPSKLDNMALPDRLDSDRYHGEQPRSNNILQPMQSRPQEVLVITNNSDGGPGTLRQALLDAQPDDVITFDPNAFSPAAPTTISLASPLPSIGQVGLTLDASNAGVILDGSAAGAEMAPGLKVIADSVTVRGLQIVSFSGYGIELHGQNNVIGGDPGLGAGPLGQGNLFSDNGQSGIGLFGVETFSNTVSGNLIGTDLTGQLAWGNQRDGVHVNGAHHNLIGDNVIGGNQGAGIQICCTPDSAYNTVRDNLIGVGSDGETAVPNFWKGIVVSDGANHNTIGPGNVIANTSSGDGIGIIGGFAPGNTILGNSVYDNQGSGIALWNENMELVHVPAIAAFDLAAGSVSGVACTNCLVQIYSDEDNEGRVFEGQAVADDNGGFAIENGGPLTGPHLTATATDASGTTSMFSVPTIGARSVGLQDSNTSPFRAISTRRADQLVDNRIGFYVQDQSWVDGGIADADVLNGLGVKRARGQMNDPDAFSIDWSSDELLIHANFDQMITGLTQNGIEMTYILIFWDKEHYRQTGQLSLPRFQSEEEIQRYLDFVHLMVQAFGDRVDSWELWNEPGYDPECNEPLPGAIQCIPVETYIDVAQRAIALIRQEDPEARIVVPSYHAWDPPELYQNYLYRILESELMPMVDGIAWHPFIVHLDPAECGGEFFDRYWETVFPEIKSIAIAHGFQGEFRADELRFAIRPPGSTNPCAVWDRTASKYLVREIVHHLGEDVSAGTIMNGDSQVQVLERLGTLLAGAQVASPSIEISTTITNAISYTFALANGDHLLAVWRHVDITEEDVGLGATIELPGFAGHTAFGIDVLNGFQQALNTHAEGETLVIPSLLLREYPLLVRLAPPRTIFLPLILKGQGAGVRR